MRSPYDMDRDELADVVAAIQRELYLERDPQMTFVWNPEKDVECPSALDLLDEIMADSGLHPKPGPKAQPFKHRPQEIEEFELGAGRREGTWFSGQRFEAAVSPNRKLADVTDRKERKTLIVLDIEALRELRDLAGELVEFMEKG